MGNGGRPWPPEMGDKPMTAVRENSESLVSLIDRIIAASVFRAMRQTDANLALYERQYGLSDRSRHWAQPAPKEKQ